METPSRIRYPQNPVFSSWLNVRGRGDKFRRVDPLLVPPLVSKLKYGVNPISVEYAMRLELAQTPSDKPFKAEDICTFQQDIDLIRKFKEKVIADYIASEQAQIKR